MKVLHESVLASAVARKHGLELDGGHEHVTQLRRLLHQVNHPSIVKTLCERCLMVVNGFAKPTKPRNDNGLLAASERDQHAADPRMGDDEAGAANVLDHRLEWKKVETVGSFGSNRRRAMLDDQDLCELQAVEGSQEAIKGRLIRADSHKNH
jgi:hypothetical protein